MNPVHNQKKRKPSSPSLQGQLRIIGGDWRGRKLAFEAVDGLRPTPDRVRETVFNWLMAVVPGAKCLDAFAGSGALGLEALSRGAGAVDFVELNAAASQQLRANLALLKCDSGKVCTSSAEAFLAASQQVYDLVFLDPPFRKALLASCIPLLEERLAASSWVYIETGKEEQLPILPEYWQLHREKSAGQVAYRLFKVAKP
jgi:16S rRNA (guanine966-N2)-methyltransferase